MLATSALAQEPADDPFRYLEDASDPRTEAFFREQGERARQALDAIPGRAALAARIRALSGSATTITSLAIGGPRVFYLRQGPGEAAAMLCMREGLAAAERVLLDPARYARGAMPPAIDWISPSPDGRHVAFGVAAAGEDVVLRVVAVDTGQVLPLEIGRTPFNAGLGWHPDGRAFYYARAPEGGSGARRYANMRVYRHVLGRDTQRDEIVFAAGVGGARGVPEIVHPTLHLPLESRYAYAIAREGRRREIAVHVAEQKDLAAGKPRWHRIAGFEDEVLAVEGWRDDLYLLSKRNAPRHRVLRVGARAADLSGARVVAPQGESVIQAFGLARDAIYLKTMVGGVDRLERMQLGLLGAKAAEYVRTPFDFGITQLVTTPRAEGAILRMQGWIEPPRIVQVDRRADLRDTKLYPPSTADYSEMDEVRLYAPSHDGTRIPVTLLYRKSTRLSGDNPTLLLGYGAYGVAIEPRFDPARLAWLEGGGVIAIAHLRGGGEYGEAWHQAGRREAKVNTVLDFIAVSEFLVSYGFTRPQRLAIQGSGAGGVPAAGALVRRPGLYAAVVARSPMADMLRFELAAEGPASVPEFGSASVPGERESLAAISAYHQVKDGAAYPAVLVVAGTGDPRVAPWQPAKLAARLQAANPQGKPVLLRAGYDPGEQPGGPRPHREEELADIYAFLLWQMGDPKYQPPPPPPAPSPPPPPPPPEPPARTEPAPAEAPKAPPEIPGGRSEPEAAPR